MKGRLVAVMVVLVALLMLAVPASAGRAPSGPPQVAGCYNYTATVLTNTCPISVPPSDTGMMQVDQDGSTLTLTTTDGLMDGSTTLNNDGSISLSGTIAGDPCPSGATCTYTAGGKFAERKGVMGFSGKGKTTVTQYVLGFPVTCSITASTVATRTSTEACVFPTPVPTVTAMTVR